MKYLLTALLLFSAVVSTGCDAMFMPVAMTVDQYDTVIGPVWHLAPEMRTRGHTAEDAKARYARTINTNYRTSLDDIASFWLLDRPSRLSPYPTP